MYNHPFFMILNVAVGGNFGGAVGAETTFPQQMLVDYVRLYQTEQRPVQFETTINDTFAGWTKITLPFTDFQGQAGKLWTARLFRASASRCPAISRISSGVGQWSRNSAGQQPPGTRWPECSRSGFRRWHHRSILLDQLRLYYDDVTPPTVAITSSAAGITATGPITFTFTFSEDVGTISPPMTSPSSVAQQARSIVSAAPWRRWS